MLGVWAVLTLTGVLYSVWLGYGGRAFAATITAFAFFFLVMLLFAARGVEDRLSSSSHLFSPLLPTINQSAPGRILRRSSSSGWQ